MLCTAGGYTCCRVYIVRTVAAVSLMAIPEIGSTTLILICMNFVWLQIPLYGHMVLSYVGLALYLWVGIVFMFYNVFVSNFEKLNAS